MELFSALYEHLVVPFLLFPDLCILAGIQSTAVSPSVGFPEGIGVHSPDQQVLDQYRPGRGGKSVSQFCENTEQLQKPQEEHSGEKLLGKRNLKQKNYLSPVFTV